MKNEVRIYLTIPDAKLSPNARVHWAVKSKLTKSHRLRAMIAANPHKGLRFTSYRIVFTWPDKRRRDRDNAISRCKSYLDGISDAIGQDDSEWDFNGVKFDEPSKENQGVRIIFEVSE